MKKFIIFGVAGYIAPRHLTAIKQTNNELLAAYDVSDSVGILDSYFPDTDFFTTFEGFSDFVDLNINNGIKIDFASICTPNHLHFDQIKWCLAKGISVICEKPLVLNTKELKQLKELEMESSASVFSILQLRLHPSIQKLEKKISKIKSKRKIDVSLKYITSRGKWYHKSWKGDDDKSGGIATNIGVHFFDMLNYIFGDFEKLIIDYKDDKTCFGKLNFEMASVNWFLSIDSMHLPENAVVGEKITYRSIKIEDQELEFSEGFTDLHTVSYRNILNNKGFGIDENEAAIKIVESIQNFNKE